MGTVGEDAPAEPPRARAAGAAQEFSEIVRFERIDSTNRYARDAAETGAAHGLVVIASEQTAGRGRMGRRWQAPAGSALLCSVLFRTALPAERFHLLPSVMALAALDAVDAVVGYGAAIKWPNDLLAGNRKLAGILAEVVPAPRTPGSPAPVQSGTAVVAGLGLNVAWPPGWPPAGADRELELLARQATTLSALAGRTIDLEEVTAAFLAALRRRHAELGAAPEETLRAYRRRCTTIGRSVRVMLADGEVRGDVVDVMEDGRLLLVADGKLRAFEAGDVVHVR